MCCGTRWPDASAAASATGESGATRVVARRSFSASMRACVVGDDRCEDLR